MIILKRIRIIVAVIISAILLASVGSYVLNQTSGSEPFYVGVTYCGESVEEAKQLIDKVKDYTNLFVIQSGPLQGQPEKMNQIIEYATNSDLFFIVYFGNKYSNLRNIWFETFDHRWNDHFLGVYFGDEPAGKMLDGTIGFPEEPPIQPITKLEDGTVTFRYYNPSSEISSFVYFSYKNDGTISVRTNKMETEGPSIRIYATYFTNGTIRVETSGPNETRIQVEDYVPFSFEECGIFPPLLIMMKLLIGL